jgi:hypothetical protein
MVFRYALLVCFCSAFKFLFFQLLLLLLLLWCMVLTWTCDEVVVHVQGITDWQLLLIQELCDVGSLYAAMQAKR